MIHVKIDFPAGRWHATAWGSHVNEGVPEWPPCPWRIERALLAAWHWKHTRQDEATLRTLLEKLAGVLPDYFLPEASAAHTRHFMPAIAGPKETKTKIFDTFVHVNKGQSLWIRWDVALTLPEHALLGKLFASLNYMGRAESLVIATLLDESDSKPADELFSTAPIAAGNAKTASAGEIVRLLAPQETASYAAWLATQQGCAGSETAGAKPKKTKSKKSAGELPKTVFDALQLDTADWKKDGWSIPPGARWVEYLRPRNCFKIAPATAPRKIAAEHLPTVARFAVVSKVPPSITQALSLSERFHKALCKFLENEDEAHPDFKKDKETITGLNAETSAPHRGVGGHIYFLPECDPHGFISHMTLYARNGFGAVASRIFGKLRRVWGADGFEVKIVLLATGVISDFENIVPNFRPAETWRSLTPFFPVRHAKRASKRDSEKGDLVIGEPAHDCWRLLEIEGYSVESVQKTNSPARIEHAHFLRTIPCLEFQRIRHTGTGNQVGHHGTALEIKFKEKTIMPLGIGFGAHFGLGVFLPAEESS